MYDKFIQWCYHAAWLEWFRNSTYPIPVLQSFHLLGLTTVLGVVCILGIRMLGLGFRDFPLRSLWNNTIKWFVGALIMTMSAGVIIALIDPTRYFANIPFHIKMCLLLLAIIFQFSVVRKVSRGEEPTISGRTTVGRATVGTLALLLWFGVGWGGRLIAFFM